MHIVLINLKKQGQKLYKNPIKLQVIYWVLAEHGMLPYISFWDEEVDYKLEQCDFAIIDMTESHEKIEHIISRIQAQNIILINSDCHISKLVMNQFSQKRIICYDYAVFMEHITKIFDIPNFDISNRNDRKNKLLLTNTIIENINKSGVQYFAEAVARGCEGNCSFCKISCMQSHNLSFVKYSSIDFILNSAKLLSNNLFIQFTDENFFGLSESRLYRVCNFAKNLCESHFKGILGVDTRIDTVPISNHKTKPIFSVLEKSWELMMQAGLKYCFIGIESFDNNQLNRYEKKIYTKKITDILQFFRSNKIFYTLGLILWDPKVSCIELQNNLEVIENNGLLGKTASLLKPLRIIPGSIYENKYILHSSKFSVPSGGSKEWDNIASFYENRKIRYMARLLFPIYGAFDHAGYRHSDVSLFEALYDENTPIIFFKIPKKIADIELKCIKQLLSYNEIKLENMSVGLLAKDVIPKIESIYKELLFLENRFDNQIQKIYDYYKSVFANCLSNLQELMDI